MFATIFLSYMYCVAENFFEGYIFFFVNCNFGGGHPEPYCVYTLCKSLWPCFDPHTKKQQRLFPLKDFLLYGNSYQRAGWELVGMVTSGNTCKGENH